MIKAEFKARGGEIRGFSLGGHSGFSAAGSDIVCAAVSSAVQLTANTITEFFCDSAVVEVGDNLISLMLPEDCKPESVRLLDSFRTHLEFLSEDYKGTIKITISEV